MSDRTNTIFGWILFSGIVALMLRFFSTLIYPDHEPETEGFPIAAAEEEGGADAGPSLATLLASADPAAGENIFAKCISCHTIASGGANGIGPNLFGVVGKPIGSHVAGFAYSSALSGHGGDWNYENLDAWLANPRGFASGTLMSFAGLSNPQDRANVIAYMVANGGGPAFPTPEAPVEAAADAGDAAADAGEDVAGEAAAAE